MSFLVTPRAPALPRDGPLPPPTGPGEGRGVLVAAVQRLVNSVPLSALHASYRFCHRHVIVVTLVLRHSQTNVCIELKELEGGVRATSILCLLGIGLGLGSVLVYKLYRSIFSNALPDGTTSPQPKKRPTTPSQTSQVFPEPRPVDIFSPETPDSGISCQLETSVDPGEHCPQGHHHGNMLRHRRCLPHQTQEGLPEEVEGEEGAWCIHGKDMLVAACPECVLSRDRPQGCYSCERLTDRHSQGAERFQSLPKARHRLGSSRAESADAGFGSMNESGRIASLSLSKITSDNESVGHFSAPAGYHLPHGNFSGQHRSEGGLYQYPRHSSFTEEPYSEHSSPLGERRGRLKRNYDYRDLDDVAPSPHDSTHLGDCDTSSQRCYASFEIGEPQGRKHSTPHQWDLDSRYLQNRSHTPFESRDNDLDGMLEDSGRSRPLRREPHSFASELSAYSDYSIQESMQSSMFESSEIGRMTTSSMDVIQNELQQIRSDLNTMNERVQGMHTSKEDLIAMLTLTPNILEDSPTQQNYKLVQRRQKKAMARRNRYCRSRSASVDHDLEDLANGNPRKSFPSGGGGGEFMWDYQSDLAMDDSALNFVAHRPVFGDLVQSDDSHSTCQSPTLEHVKKYWENSLSGKHQHSPGNESDASRKMTASRTFNSVSDMYIDDDLSSPFHPGHLDTVQDNESFYLESSHRKIPEGSYDTKPDVAAAGEYYEINRQPDGHCNNNGDNMPVENNKVSRINVNVDPSGSVRANDGSICLECGSPSHTASKHYKEAGKPKSISPNTSLNTTSDTLQSLCPNCGHTASSLPGVRGALDITGSSNSSSVGFTSHNSSGSTSARRWEVQNVGERINIFEYAEKQLTGDGSRETTMKKGYHQLCSLLGETVLRPVRGDHYCVLRATLYQVTANRHPVLAHLGPLHTLLQDMRVFKLAKYDFLQNWSFANRLPYSPDTLLVQLNECVTVLYEQLTLTSQLQNRADRERHLVELFNRHPEADLQMMEGIKALMMLKAIHLHEDYTARRRDTPVFAWLMFSRETSQTPAALFKNHINPLGDISGTDQVGMFLLGHTLGVKIQVVRPARHGQDDFISHYPDEGADNFPKVDLVEEDKHYNVILP